MKRSPLSRTSALRRRHSLRARRKPADRTDPARAIWKVPHAGFCQCGCNRFALHLERHHVTTLEAIKAEGRMDVAWDLGNSMLLHELCHSRHTSAFRKIRLEKVPELALAFAVDLLGEDRAALYLARHYDCAHRWSA